MQAHINAAKDSINNIVNKLVNGKEGNVEKLRLSLVAYRDYSDSNRFEILDFTLSVDAFRDFCGKVSYSFIG